MEHIVDDSALAGLAGILLTLRQAELDRPCSIARLRKLCGLRQSVLARQLAILAEQGWLAAEGDSVRLTAAGLALCAELAPQQV